MIATTIRITQRRYDLREALGQLLAIHTYDHISTATGVPITSLRNWRTKPGGAHASWSHVDALMRFYAHIYGADRAAALELPHDEDDA